MSALGDQIRQAEGAPHSSRDELVQAHLEIIAGLRVIENALSRIGDVLRAQDEAHARAQELASAPPPAPPEDQEHDPTAPCPHPMERRRTAEGFGSGGQVVVFCDRCGEQVPSG